MSARGSRFLGNTLAGALLALVGGCAPAAHEGPPAAPAPAAPPSASASAGARPEPAPKVFVGEEARLPDVDRTAALEPFTLRVESADDATRPAALIARAKAALALAEHRSQGRLTRLGPMDLEWAAFCMRAQHDAGEIVRRFPDAPEAPEAQYLLGLANDYPYLSDFRAAAEAYALTVERYPGTDAARRAELRFRYLEKLAEPMKESGHGP